MLFSAYGEILELRMMKDHNGNSKGFCFVRFATKDAAFKARKEKDGVMLQGKKIGVALSSDQDSLFFGNLRKDWSSEEFNKLVRQAFKDVVSVDLAMPPSSGHSGKKQLNRGFAFVRFSSHAAAARAYRLGSKPDFLLAGNWHPVIDWAEKEPEIDPEEMAKTKVAFVGNLPTNTDEEYLKKLFEPLGKVSVERVALSRKGHFPVGFVHFASRSVTVARPVEKDRKRVHEETKSEPLNKSRDRPDSSHDRPTHDSSDYKSKAPRLDDPANFEPQIVNLPNKSLFDLIKVSDSADPYEAAVISLPSAVTERLLRVLRLGIATRYDLDIRCITSLKELPESAAIAVLDQFMLSGADKRDKGVYFASLVSRHQVGKFGLGWNTSHLPRKSSDYAPKDNELHNLRAPLHVQAVDHSATRHGSYASSPCLYPYSSLYDDPLTSRSSVGKLGEVVPTYRAPVSSNFRHGTGIGSGSFHASAERPTERPQIKFDPFTGQPYKFDPFTGEPIQPDLHPRRSASLI
ncbi:APOBEC1 complementation factor-like [Cocos nucifera]|uniref:APOBEC1 complementation factor-like n=1 Tax=Cocos nucifera TaxID=13894 RepID=A0A8K0ID38_COCNU|nr:APOBEC1 complementation factor-like [Cocos nucifera]